MNAPASTARAKIVSVGIPALAAPTSVALAAICGGISASNDGWGWFSSLIGGS